MTLWDVADLYEEWRERPPLRAMVQAWTGIGKEQKKSDPKQLATEIASLPGSSVRSAPSPEMARLIELSKTNG